MARANGLKRYETRHCPKEMPGAWTVMRHAPDGVIRVVGLEPDVEYIIEARCVPISGTPSEWVRWEHTVIGPTDVPPIPTDMTVSRGSDHVLVSCSFPAQFAADSEIEFQWAPDVDDLPGDWNFLERVHGNKAKDTYLTGEKRWYRARAINYQGSASEWTAPVSERAKTSEDGATATAPSTENLLGSGAGQTFRTSGGGWIKRYYNRKSLGALGIEIGDLISVSLGLRTTDGNKAGRILVQFHDAAGSLIGTGGSSAWASPPGWSRQKLEGLTVPATAATITVGADANATAGEIECRRAILNLGAIAAPFSPPAQGAETGSGNLAGGNPAEETEDISTPGGATEPVYRHPSGPVGGSGAGVVKELGATVLR